MTRSEFIEALKIQTSDAAVFCTKKTLERPAGRKPRERDVELSECYKSLSEPSRVFVESAMREAAELAVFSVLCILDGVSAIENGPDKGDLKLIYVKEAEEVLLNDPSKGFLHDVYNSLCQQTSPVLPLRPETRLYEVGTSLQLRENQTSNDALDLHAVVQKTGKPAEARTPAIALPKNEHRKL